MQSHKYLFFILFFSWCLWLGSVTASRSLTYELNPGCKTNTSECDRSKVLHVESSRPGNNTFHYLWAFVYGYAPAIFTFETDASAKLTIDWKNLHVATKDPKPAPGSISFVKGSVHNAQALELTQLYFVNFTNTATVMPLNLQETQFTATQVTANSGEVSYMFESVKSDFYGNMEIVLTAHAEAGRSSEIPRLQFTESSNLMKITVKNYTLPQKDSEKTYIKSQLVSNLTLAFESSETKEGLHEHTSIDDEYTPGVFTRFIYDVLSTKAATKSSDVNATAYAEWKPVAYFDDSKTIAKSLKVSKPETTSGIKLATNSSLLAAYFSDAGETHLTALNAFLFGNSDDFSADFLDYNYENTKYLQFSVAFGLNAVPEETLSMTLKIVIAVGLGLPMLVFLLSIVYTVVTKIRSRNGDGDFAALTEEVAS